MYIDTHLGWYSFFISVFECLKCQVQFLGDLSAEHLFDVRKPMVLAMVVVSTHQNNTTFSPDQIPICPSKQILCCILCPFSFLVVELLAGVLARGGTGFLEHPEEPARPGQTVGNCGRCALSLGLRKCRLVDQGRYGQIIKPTRLLLVNLPRAQHMSCKTMGQRFGCRDTYSR